MEKHLKRKSIFYSREFTPSWSIGRKFRWIENYTYGLRFVGYADEIYYYIRHRGWFTRDDGWDGEVLRGIVVQLPARHGREQYLAGYDDPNNDGCGCFEMDIYDDKDEAAKAADHTAESFADRERDYNRAWDAVQLAEDTLGQSRQDVQDELTTIRMLKGVGLVNPREWESANLMLVVAWDEYRDTIHMRQNAYDDLEREGGSRFDF